MSKRKQAPTDADAKSSDKSKKKPRIDLESGGDPFDRSSDGVLLLSVAEEIFHDSGAVAKNSIPVEKLRAFLKAVKDNHRKNAYHNWHHAFHVVYNTYRFLKPSLSLFSSTSVLAILIAAICHDLDHCGVSNALLISRKDAIALQFDNKSPLENHSLELTFDLLSKEQTNILCNVPSKAVTEIRGLIQSIILATDISNADNIKSVHSEWERHAAKFRANNFTHSSSLARMTVLCADIGICQEPFAAFIAWVRRLFAENVAMDPKITADTFYAGQLKFLEGYASPLYHTVAKANVLEGFGAVCSRFDENKTKMQQSNCLFPSGAHANGSALSSDSSSSSSSSSSAGDAKHATSNGASSSSSPVFDSANSNSHSANSNGETSSDKDDASKSAKSTKRATPRNKSAKS